MHKHTKKLAKEAGFIFWSKDEHPHAPIDWSCDYDLELEKFEELVRKDERAKLLLNVNAMLDNMHIVSNGRHNYWKVAKNLINAEFGESK